MQNRSYRRNLRVELARAGLTQQDLATKLSVPPTTLSDWLRGAHPAPADLHQRIEHALKLKRGALTTPTGGAR